MFVVHHVDGIPDRGFQPLGLSAYWSRNENRLRAEAQRLPSSTYKSVPLHVDTHASIRRRHARRPQQRVPSESRGDLRVPERLSDTWGPRRHQALDQRDQEDPEETCLGQVRHKKRVSPATTGPQAIQRYHGGPGEI